METPQLLEVCIPTRTRSDYFFQAVQSVADAATPDLSLLVFQNSPAPIWQESDLPAFPGPKRLECSHGDLAIADSWNAVLERCHAEWIHILHDDDWVEPQFYETFFRDLEANPTIGLWMCGTMDHYSEEGVDRVHENRLPDLVSWDPEAIAELIFEKSKSRCVSVILRREVVVRLGGFDERMAHSLDGDLFLRVAQAAGACFSASILGNYRIHAASSTGLGRLFQRGALMSLPILDDRRMLQDHQVLLSKLQAANLRLPAIRRYSSGVIFGALRYYVRRGRIGSLLLWPKYLAGHLYAFLVKAHLPPQMWK